MELKHASEKTKSVDSKSTKTSPKILTAEGWKRRQLKKLKSKES